MIDLDSEDNNAEDTEAKIIDVQSIIDEDCNSTGESSEMSLPVEFSDCEHDSLPEFEDLQEEEEINDLDDDDQDDLILEDTSEVWVVEQSHRRMSFDSIGRLSVIPEEDNIEIIEINDVDKELSANAAINILSVEKDDKLITNFQIVKFEKNDKYKKNQGNENFEVLQFIVNKQLSESRRRPTKASLARKRRIRENYPDLNISKKSKC